MITKHDSLIVSLIGAPLGRSAVGAARSKSSVSTALGRSDDHYIPSP